MKKDKELINKTNILLNKLNDSDFLNELSVFIEKCFKKINLQSGVDVVRFQSDIVSKDLGLNSLEIGFSYGITHHIDEINGKTVMIPISKNSSRYFFKYYDFIKKHEYQCILDQFKPYFFDDCKLHSLCMDFTSHKTPPRKPLVFILLS